MHKSLGSAFERGEFQRLACFFFFPVAYLFINIDQIFNFTTEVPVYILTQRQKADRVPCFPDRASNTSRYDTTLSY